MGVSTNLEGFAKSVFNQDSLQKFNKMNTIWLVAYFVILRFLQSYELVGVFLAYTIFYWMRVAIAIWTSVASSEYIQWKTIVKAFAPSVVELVAFVIGNQLSSIVMKSMNETIGFLVCCAIGGVHLVVFGWLRRHTIKDFRAALKQ